MKNKNNYLQLNLKSDKSLTHRLIIISSIMNCHIKLENINFCDDILTTISCMQELGVDISENRFNNTVIINGKGLHSLKKPTRNLDCKNSATTMRLLAGLLVGQPFEVVLTGDQSLLNRPMDRIINPLKELGYDIIGKDNKYAPIVINNHLSSDKSNTNITSNLHNNNSYKLNVNQKVLDKNKNKIINYFNFKKDKIIFNNKTNSAQVKSAIMLSSLYFGKCFGIKESKESRNHTELLFEYFYNKLYNNETLGNLSLNIPGDISNASFMIVASILLNQKIIIRNVLLNKTRTKFLDVIERTGVRYKIMNKCKFLNEEVGDIIITRIPKVLKSFNVKESDIPCLIDEIPVLSILAIACDGKSTFHNVNELTKKESNRVLAIVENITKMNGKAKVINTQNKISLRIVGDKNIRKKKSLVATNITTYNDHRIAMSFDIASILCKSNNKLDNINCINISYPDYYIDKNKLFNSFKHFF